MCMGTLDKKRTRLLSIPNDYSYTEAKSSLRAYGFVEDNKGKTSGSRVKFYRECDNRKIIIHKPHPGNIMPVVVVKQLAEFVETIS